MSHLDVVQAKRHSSKRVIEGGIVPKLLPRRWAQRVDCRERDSRHDDGCVTTPDTRTTAANNGSCPTTRERYSHDRARERGAMAIRKPVQRDLEPPLPPPLFFFFFFFYPGGRPRAARRPLARVKPLSHAAGRGARSTPAFFFGGAQAFFCNSGAEAVEPRSRAPERRASASRSRSREASTTDLGALSVTGQPAKRAAFAPLPGRCALRAAPRRRGARGSRGRAGRARPTANLSEGGVVPLDADFVEALPRSRRSSASTRWSGVGARGLVLRLRAAQRQARPGDAREGARECIPVGALLVSDDVTHLPGDHRSTFGANPVLLRSRRARSRAPSTTSS